MVRRKGDAGMNQGRIGSFIMECRREKGMTQAQLAEKLHITDRAVSKWETGKSLPDSSIMLALCEVLGITADELLGGGRETGTMQPEISSAPGAPKSRFSGWAGKRWWGSVLFSGGLFAGVLTCFICDTVLSGRLTWSLVVAISAVYTWAVFFPLLALRKGGLTGSLASLSVFTIPYLYGLSRLLDIRTVFTVGAAMTLLSALFLWLILIVFKCLGRTAAAAGTAFLLLAGLVFAVNAVLYVLGAAPSPDGWNLLSILLFLMAAAVSFTWKRGGEGK